jgi:hypothetical protein
LVKGLKDVFLDIFIHPDSSVHDLELQDDRSLLDCLRVLDERGGGFRRASFEEER